MEDFRRQYDDNWNEIKLFMKEQRDANQLSSDYRAADSVKQENILAEAKKTNGRITELERKVQGYDAIIQDRKEAKASNLNLYITIATVFMAVVTLVALFKSWR